MAKDCIRRGSNPRGNLIPVGLKPNALDHSATDAVFFFFRQLHNDRYNTFTPLIPSYHTQCIFTIYYHLHPDVSPNDQHTHIHTHTHTHPGQHFTLSLSITLYCYMPLIWSLMHLLCATILPPISLYHPPRKYIPNKQPTYFRTDRSFYENYFTIKGPTLSTRYKEPKKVCFYFDWKFVSDNSNPSNSRG